MVTFGILLGIVLAAAIVIAAVALVGGAGLIAVFGDLIICGLIIGLLIKLFRKRK